MIQREKHPIFIDRVGEIHTTNQGYRVEIIKHLCDTNYNVRFTNTRIIVSNRQYSNIKRGHIANPLHRSVYNIGFLGIGKYTKRVENKMSKCYQTWQSMLERGYSKKYKLKKPTYKDVTVCEEWHNFQNFAQWFEDNYKEGFELDKDILVKGNKIYSPETCCFVPQVINIIYVKSSTSRSGLPIGVTRSGKKFRGRFGKNREHLGLFNTPEEAFQAYKIAKELYIIKMAITWRHLIGEKVYRAMINYKVEITD